MERGVKRKLFEADLEDGLTLTDQQTSFLYISSQKKLENMSKCQRGFSLERLLLIAKLTNRLKLKLETLKQAQQFFHVPSIAQITNSIFRNSVSTQKQDTLPDISTFMFPMAPCSPFPVLVSSSTEEDDEVSGYSGLGSTVTELSHGNSCDSPMPFYHSTGLNSLMPTTASHSTGYFTNPSHVISFTSFNSETGNLTPQWLDMSTSDNRSTSNLTSEWSSVESMDTSNMVSQWPDCDNLSSSNWTSQLPVANVASMNTSSRTDMLPNNEGASASSSQMSGQSEGNLAEELKYLEELGIFSTNQPVKRSW